MENLMKMPQIGKTIPTLLTKTLKDIQHSFSENSYVVVSICRICKIFDQPEME